MADISTQHLMDQKTGTRPPRVQITYDVEIGDAFEKKDIPFVLGILADLSGSNTHKNEDPDDPEHLFKNRRFYDLDPDTFNDIMARVSPQYDGALLTGDTTPDIDADNAAFTLNFHSMDDFSPASLAKKIPGLKTLLDQRHALADLMAKLDGNEGLNKALVRVANDPDPDQKDLKALQAYTPPTTA